VAQLVLGLVGFQERLLDDAREIKLAAQPIVDLEPGQRAKVFPIALQLQAVRLTRLVHLGSYEEERKAGESCAVRNNFFLTHPIPRVEAVRIMAEVVCRTRGGWP